MTLPWQGATRAETRANYIKHCVEHDGVAQSLADELVAFMASLPPWLSECELTRVCLTDEAWEVLYDDRRWIVSFGSRDDEGKPWELWVSDRANRESGRSALANCCGIDSGAVMFALLVAAARTEGGT